MNNKNKKFPNLTKDGRVLSQNTEEVDSTKPNKKKIAAILTGVAAAGAVAVGALIPRGAENTPVIEQERTEIEENNDGNLGIDVVPPDQSDDAGNDSTVTDFSDLKRDDGKLPDTGVPADQDPGSPSSAIVTTIPESTVVDSTLPPKEPIEDSFVNSGAVATNPTPTTLSPPVLAPNSPTPENPERG